jgi:hypothetical protein
MLFFHRSISAPRPSGFRHVQRKLAELAIGRWAEGRPRAERNPGWGGHKGLDNAVRTQFSVNFSRFPDSATPYTVPTDEARGSKASTDAYLRVGKHCAGRAMITAFNSILEA